MTAPVYGERGSPLSLVDIRDAVRGIIPDIVDAVRQEVKQGSIQTVYVNQGDSRTITQAKFIGPEYIPDVNTDGMTSTIKIEEKKVSGDDMNSALEALKKMGSK